MNISIIFVCGLMPQWAPPAEIKERTGVVPERPRLGSLIEAGVVERRGDGWVRQGKYWQKFYDAHGLEATEKGVSSIEFEDGLNDMINDELKKNPAAMGPYWSPQLHRFDPIQRPVSFQGPRVRRAQWRAFSACPMGISWPWCLLRGGSGEPDCSGFE